MDDVIGSGGRESATGGWARREGSDGELRGLRRRLRLGRRVALALAMGSAAVAAEAQTVVADGPGKVTFAHPWRAGQCPGSVAVQGAASEAVVMRRHPDGSVRHAVLTASFPAAGSYALTCAAAGSPAPIPAPAIQVQIGSLGVVSPGGAGERWGMEQRWTGTAGPILVLIDARADGQVSVSAEHTWHDTPHDPEGRAVTSYDLTITLGGAVVRRQAGVRHHPHTRWRVVLDAAPGPHLRFSPAYLASTGAVAPYDTSRVPSADTVAKTWWLDPARLHWAGKQHDPLTEAYGVTNPGFIGADEGSPLTPPQTLFLTTGHPLAWQRSLEAGAYAGNFAIHVRDRATGRVLSIDDRPSFNQDRKILYPQVRNAAGEVLSQPDAAHQPSLAFLPYLLTGDRFFWEELEFWNLYNWLERPVSSGSSWTGRNGSEGILWTGQVRSVAWSLRTLVHTAWVAPERAGYYEQKLANNFAWMNSRFPQPGGPAVGDGVGYSHLGNTTKNAIPASNPSYRSSYLPWAADSCAFDTQAWNHAILGWSLDYALRLGYPGGAPMRDHVVRPVLGLGAINPYDFWLHHLCVADGDGVLFADYTTVHAKNTAKRSAAASAGNTYWGWGGESSGYKQWARAGLIAAVNAGLPGARALFDRIEPELRAWWVDSAEWDSPEWLILPAADAPAPPPPPPPPAPTVPAAPGGLTAGAVGTSAVDLAWQDNSGDETGFRVEMSTAGGSFGQVLTTAANVTAVRVAGLAPATAYAFRLRAHNAVGSSGYSDAATATTAGGLRLAAVAPSSGPTTGGTHVTVAGSGFRDGARVSFGGVPAVSVTLHSPERLTAVAPPHPAGTTAVTVALPDGTSATLHPGYFFAPASGASDFYTLRPCRVIDTRAPQGSLGGPAFAPLGSRALRLAGSCGIPADAAAVAVNVTAIQPAAAGHLGLFPGDSFPLGTSTVGFTAGRTRAAFAIVTLATDGQGTALAFNGSAGALHLVLDVTGYYR